MQLTDTKTRDTFWWKRFACVVELPRSARSRIIGVPHRGYTFMALTLKLRPDMDKDLREVDLRDRDRPQVVTYLPEERWPQGVVAIRMKLIALGLIKIGDQ